MIVDTSALLAYFDAEESRHAAVADLIDGSLEPLVVSPYAVAELDYILSTRYGTHAEHEVLLELAGGAWVLATIETAALKRIASTVKQYSDVPIGATDASNIVLAEQYGTSRIATLDRRHFSILRFSDGSAPEVVP